jgi:NADH-quinone oxidoreductase subunit L
MSIGALALSGVFPFSGFFSKEAILGALANSPNKIWLFAGLLGALMTAYYSFRLIFFVVFPKGGIEEHPAHHGEEAHGHEEHGGEHHGYIFWCMAVPVMVLASVTVVLGFFQSSLEHFLMGPSSTVQAVAQHAAAMHEGAEGAHAAAGHGAGHYILLFTAVGCALTGICGHGWNLAREVPSRKVFCIDFQELKSFLPDAGIWMIS